MFWQRDIKDTQRKMINIEKEKIEQISDKIRNVKSIFNFSVSLCVFGLIILSIGCSELEKPKPEVFYSQTNPPTKQEFRWSNGKTPKSFDPAIASAPPETDIVRAIYDGLTENDSTTLKAIPAISYSWSNSEDYKVWTFKLRQDAKWSNGEMVTAKDFVRSWKRLADMGDKVSHHQLLKNIVGMNIYEDDGNSQKESDTDIFSLQETTKEIEKKTQEVIKNVGELKTDKDSGKDSKKETSELEKNTAQKTDEKKPVEPVKKKVKNKVELGVKAIAKDTLQVTLIKPDKEFPELVANPIFRPVYANGKEFEGESLNADIITNGAFRIFSVGQDGITLDRAEYYYNKENIHLERVRFVPTNDADGALEAYRNGQVDVVTNAQFEPLALKILLPYTDFKKVTHSALNFYEFNRKQAPFNDRRVREALAISIKRDRLTTDEMEGSTKSAFNYLPFEEKHKKGKINEDIGRAKNLLTTAGFPNGVGFPTIRLIINRNNIQQRIAKAVAEMWKQNLNIETEIVVKEFEEIETAKKEGDFDLVRRGIVLPTTDETANMLAIFSPRKTPDNNEEKVEKTETGSKEKELNKTQNTNTNTVFESKTNSENPLNFNAGNNNMSFENELYIDTGNEEKTILTEAEAILEVPAIPLYFSTSYSLVKPYIQGFNMNSLDAPLLKGVKIDNNWQPKKTNSES